jgi:hypothetical protein
MIGIQNVVGAGGSGGPLISMRDPVNRFMGIGLGSFVLMINRRSNLGSSGCPFPEEKCWWVLLGKHLSHCRQSLCNRYVSAICSPSILSRYALISSVVSDCRTSSRRDTDIFGWE